MKTKQNSHDQTARALLALQDDMRERATLDERIRIQFETLARRHGVEPL
jgi:hypothetical protein